LWYLFNWKYRNVNWYIFSYDVKIIEKLVNHIDNDTCRRVRANGERMYRKFEIFKIIERNNPANLID